MIFNVIEGKHPVIQYSLTITQREKFCAPNTGVSLHGPALYDNVGSQLLSIHFSLFFFLKKLWSLLLHLYTGFTYCLSVEYYTLQSINLFTSHVSLVLYILHI